MRKSIIRIFGGAILAVLFTALAGVSYGQTVVVSPGNMNGWSFAATDGNGNLAISSPYTGAIGQMVYGPASPPLGVGSAELATAVGGGDGSVQIGTAAYNGLPLSSILQLSYSTYDTANNGSQFPYMQIAVSMDGSGSPASEDILSFEPPYQTAPFTSPNPSNPGGLPDQGAETMNTWQTWNAQEGGWWDDYVFTPGAYESPSAPGVNSLAAYEAIYTNATIMGSGYPGNSGIELMVGYASSSDLFTGYVDYVTIGTPSGTTTFDFEPVPEPGTITLVGMGLLGMLAFCRRRK